ncbi:MAG: hypothetical protein COA78_15845 [Blastopirellula sp.]|nr:MAG: hypothetical protein COA78_15845 [Blastopirellula sp.]
MDRPTRPDLSITIQVLNEEELIDYAPDERYWNLWKINFMGSSDEIIKQAKANIKLVVIRIIFHNDSENSIPFEFRNLKCKAELLGLSVQDDSGYQIKAEHGLLLRLKPSDRAMPILEPDGEIVYDLVGEVFDEWLKFPGANYRIPENQILNLSFHYQGNSSPSVRYEVSQSATQ